MKRCLVLLVVVGSFGAACSRGGASEPTAPAPNPEVGDTPLKDAYAAAFGVGVAVSAAQLDRAAETELLNRHFNMVVAENQMNADVMAPREGETVWSHADAIVRARRSQRHARSRPRLGVAPVDAGQGCWKEATRRSSGSVSKPT